MVEKTAMCPMCDEYQIDPRKLEALDKYDTLRAHAEAMAGRLVRAREFIAMVDALTGDADMLSDAGRPLTYEEVKDRIRAILREWDEKAVSLLDAYRADFPAQKDQQQ